MPLKKKYHDVTKKNKRGHQCMCNLRNAEQEAFEKCWAHSPLRAATLPFTVVATVARRLRIDVHNDNDDDNA